MSERACCGSHAAACAAANASASRQERGRGCCCTRAKPSWPSPACTPPIRSEPTPTGSRLLDEPWFLAESDEPDVAAAGWALEWKIRTDIEQPCGAAGGARQRGPGRGAADPARDRGRGTLLTPPCRMAIFSGFTQPFCTSTSLPEKARSCQRPHRRRLRGHESPGLGKPGGLRHRQRNLRCCLASDTSRRTSALIAVGLVIFALLRRVVAAASSAPDEGVRNVRRLAVRRADSDILARPRSAARP